MFELKIIIFSLSINLNMLTWEGINNLGRAGHLTTICIKKTEQVVFLQN